MDKTNNPLRKLFNKFGIDIHKYTITPPKFGLLVKHSIDTVIDVGANTGQFAQEARKALPHAEIYSFEPIKECYASLCKTMQKDKAFKPFNCALGSADALTTIHKSEYSPSSSILPMATSHKELFPHTAQSTDETITVRKLDDIPELNPEKLKKNILLKIDTQGFEAEVLKGAHNFLQHTSVVLIETSFVRLYEKQPLFDDIYKILTGQGFTFVGMLHQKFNKTTGEVIFSDSLFIRS